MGIGKVAAIYMAGRQKEMQIAASGTEHEARIELARVQAQLESLQERYEEVKTERDALKASVMSRILEQGESILPDIKES
jgi:uncharacterized protein YlxW (UPF0749 family)